MTESERKTSLYISLFAAFLVFVSAFLLFLSTRPQSHKIKIGGQYFVAEIAATAMAREKGLSGRQELAKDHAMLFKFETFGGECFWMRDMSFNIDIVWLDSQNRVSAIEKNVRPDTYPKDFCHDGKNIIEFAAGTTDRLKLKVGDQADL